MGMKSKVRSMQRGAHKRGDETPVTNADLYKQSPPLLTDAELAHFRFGNRSINDFFLGLSDVLLACHKNHLPAAEVSKLLNAKRARTACGELWTPRLAWFLMKTWRTVHFQKLALEREKRQEAAKAKRSDRPARPENSAIERAVQRQQADTFQKVLRTYFKNPTLGEIFPELGSLKEALLQQERTVPEAPAATPITTASTPPDGVMARKKERRVQRLSRSATTRGEPDQMDSVPAKFDGSWKAFLDTETGRKYLGDLVRSNPRLLELANIKDVRFLGSLRARKSPHPAGAFWTDMDAEQVRLAIVAGMHQQGHK